MQKGRFPGFTLIELLVVIAIIGILASIVLVSLNGARVKARDARRASDLHTIQTALELYNNDNGHYPSYAAGCTVGTTWCYSNDPTSWGALQTALAPYLSTLPKDPINTPNGVPWTTGQYVYAYGSNGAIYDLAAQVEDSSNPNRCELKKWTYYLGGGVSFCGAYSPYILANH